MEYKIAHERTVENLEHVVAELISMGWVPLGGISFNEGWGCYGQYTQAMTRPEKDEQVKKDLDLLFGGEK